MIQFDSVSKTYPVGTIGLDEVSFQIKDNEFLFLVGPSGAGKTTILKLIMRQLLPSSGTVSIDDIVISDPNFDKVPELRQAIGMVFQDFKILSNKTVFENIAIALKIAEMPLVEIKTQVNEAVKLVGIDDKKMMFPVQLSAGELQRVAIARAIVGDRDIIIGDEPTGNLDPKTSWDIMNIFKKLEGKKTIIIATHNAEIVNTYKKRVITVVDGKIAKDSVKGGYSV